MAFKKKVCLPLRMNRSETNDSSEIMEDNDVSQKMANKLINWCEGVVCVYTFILVIVEQALKLGMEDLQMFLNENFLADAGQLVVGAFM